MTHRDKAFLKMFFAAQFVIVVLSLSGCADINTTNELIADSNKERQVAFSEGMVGCNGNAACQVGITAAFFSNTGQQFFKPDTGIDYLRAGLPWFLAIDQIATRFIKTAQTGDNQGMNIVGDNNTVSGVGNKLTATQGSTVSLPISQTISRPTAVAYGTGPVTQQPYEVRPEVLYSLVPDGTLTDGGQQ